MELLGGVVALIVRLPLWALFASPLIVGLVLLARRLHRRPSNSQSVRVLFALFAGVLLAPMPISMFMALVPNGYLAIGGQDYYALTWAWALASIPLTALLSLLAVWHYLAPPKVVSRSA